MRVTGRVLLNKLNSTLILTVVILSFLSPTPTSIAANPTFDTNGVLLLVVNVIVAVFLIFAVIRYVRRRRK
jgi:Ca2+/H+ antiporter